MVQVSYKNNWNSYGTCLVSTIGYNKDSTVEGEQNMSLNLRNTES